MKKEWGRLEYFAYANSFIPLVRIVYIGDELPTLSSYASFYCDTCGDNPELSLAEVMEHIERFHGVEIPGKVMFVTTSLGWRATIAKKSRN
jgi:hypothetical protein